MEFVRRNKYVLKCDISKFYPSIDQEILLSIIKRKIKCPDTLWLIENIVHSFPGGRNVPIGNYTSQWFGNLYLNELDRYVKHVLKGRDYIRYCDDFCLFHDDKKFLSDCRDRIGAFITEKLNLGFSNCDIFPISHGVDFLGYRHFDNYILVRKRTAKRVRRRLAALPGLYERGKITAEQYRSSAASTWGWLKHANSHNLAVRMELDALLKLLESLQGKFLLSSFRNETLRDCIKRKGWHSLEFSMASSMTHCGKQPRKKIEVLTANYPISVTLDERSRKELVTEEE